MSRPFPPPGDFPPTRWTLVQRAMADGGVYAFTALSSLCETYYRPLLAVIRSQGYSPEDADDLRQRFFIHLVNRGKFDKAIAAGVKLRAFLLQELKGFLVDHYRYSIAAKRDHRKNNYLDDPDQWRKWQTSMRYAVDQIARNCGTVAIVNESGVTFIPKEDR